MKCERCGKEHNGKFGSGRFCSRGCANKRTHSKETKKKIRSSVKKHIEKNGAFSSDEHKQNFIEAGRKANNLWVENKHKELMETDFSTLGYERLRKRIILEQDGKCNHCGIMDWNGKPISLEIDHIDGDNANNDRDNLEAICPNCHSQTKTFRGRNKKVRKKKSTVTHDEIVEAFLETGNIRQCLLKLGLAAKGANYGRVEVALSKRGIKYK